ncbi:aprX_2 [Symbiodinium microadriaticum]|nr:aprX_2 [Symbiodinium microadriaticum]
MFLGAKGLKGAESTPDSVVPAQNLTAPPDLWQGWGQVLLGNVLPIPGVYDFDLFVADYESLMSLQQRTYTVSVTSSAYPLRATIAWTDAVNVVWAAKSLLNDFDLTIITPSGVTLYGNDIKGDEFNPVERVVIDVPEVGDYKVLISSKIFPAGGSQTYGLVITSGGTVTGITTSSITTSDVNYEANRTACEAGGLNTYLRFQLEDWQEGSSWANLDFRIMNADSTAVVDSCTFVPNEELQIAEFNRIYQCAFCLPRGATYVANLNTDSVPTGSQVRVASSQCNVYLSHFQQSQNVVLDLAGNCNFCDSNQGLLNALMFANVTDDDYTDYSWYGAAVWTATDVDMNVVAAGTLLVSDEQGERYCLPPGTYEVHLNDTAMEAMSSRHAKVVFSGSGMDSVTLDGQTGVTSGSVTLVSQDFKKSSNDDDDTPITSSLGFIIGMAVGGAVLLVVALFVGWKALSNQNSKDINAGLLP